MWRLLLVLVAMGDGEEEFSEAVQQDFLTVDRLAQLFDRHVDVQRRGRASLRELLGCADKARHGLAARDVELAVEEMDQDRDGLVTFEEIHGVENEVEPIDEEDQREMEQRRADDWRLFSAADEDGDGRLTPQELRSLLYPETHQAVLRLVAEQALKRKDLNEDGELSMSEFWEGDVVTTGGEERAEEEGATFKLLDKDGSGCLSVDELMDWESGAHHTLVAFKELLRMCDDDQDGELSLEELTRHHEQLSNTDAAYHFLEWAEHYEL